MSNAGLKDKSSVGEAPRSDQCTGEFFDTVAGTLSLVEANPEIGAKISSDGLTRRALVARFPYQLVYRIRPAEIVIVAIAHLKRRPGYWKTRI